MVFDKLCHSINVCKPWRHDSGKAGNVANIHSQLLRMTAPKGEEKPIRIFTPVKKKKKKRIRLLIGHTIFFTSKENRHDQWNCFSSNRDYFVEFALSKSQCLYNNLYISIIDDDNDQIFYYACKIELSTTFPKNFEKVIRLCSVQLPRCVFEWRHNGVMCWCKCLASLPRFTARLSPHTVHVCNLIMLILKWQTEFD